MPDSPKLRWQEWSDDCASILDLIAQACPDEFRDFNERLFTPGGFDRGNAARAPGQWKTESGKALITVPSAASALGKLPDEDAFTLITLRSNDQFNSTIYGFDDRLRGLKGSREILTMNPVDMQCQGFSEGQTVTARSACSADTFR